MTPIGGYVLRDEPVELNAGRETVTVEVINTADRPLQVGSHFHFFEANRLLAFDRPAAFGRRGRQPAPHRGPGPRRHPRRRRLSIPATTAVRFEPGDKRAVDLVPSGGRQRVYGFNGLVNGWAGNGYQPRREEAEKLAEIRGFAGVPA